MVDVSIQQETTPIVKEGGLMHRVFAAWVNQMSKLDVIVGTGSPEGVVAADQYRLYIDEATPSAPVEYRKMLPDIAGNKLNGWAQT